MKYQSLKDEFLENFVEPTIPGTLGAMQVHRMQNWLFPKLQERDEWLESMIKRLMESNKASLAESDDYQRACKDILSIINKK